MVAEKQHIAVFRYSRQDLVDTVGETHVQHLVASSNDVLYVGLSQQILQFIKSIKRPGVATTCTPLFSVLIWLSILEPPYTGEPSGYRYLE